MELSSKHSLRPHATCQTCVKSPLRLQRVTLRVAGYQDEGKCCTGTDDLEGACSGTGLSSHTCAPPSWVRKQRPQTPAPDIAVDTVLAIAEHGCHNVIVHRHRAQPHTDGFVEVGCIY